MIIAIAVSGIVHGVGVFGIEGYQAQTMGNKLVGEHRAICFDFNVFYCHDRNFGEQDAAERVCKGEVDPLQSEIDRIRTGLVLSAYGWSRALSSVTSRTMT